MDLCKDALFGSSSSGGRRPSSGALWLADEQTKGRGRVEGRTWASPKNANLYFTLLVQLNDLKWEEQRRELTKLNQAVCLSVAKAIEQSLATVLGLPVASLPLALQPKIKWPNDIWINGLKCSGMLIDSEIMGMEMSVVIGVGVSARTSHAHKSDVDCLSCDRSLFTPAAHPCV
jgi:BirA family biotin operon repressor/biotin-[acetyl-CoA-carboxylase] ligase